ncbi:hypothetical protein [Methylobacillus glycogenes]|uniref:hypothetical protein n=1 Tax=Methylobacillus glycogenes TaxID=406 RepID=UPI00131F18A3|nr:hypothetical protein [Methylobacillus glycogenes]MBL8505742.1 hypothetical protein [Methylobacillus glycogenes]
MLVDRFIIQFDKGLRKLLTQQDCPLSKASVVQPLAATSAAIKRNLDKLRTTKPQ